MAICPQCSIRLDMHERVCRRCGFDLADARLRPPAGDPRRDDAPGGADSSGGGRPGPFARRLIDFAGLLGQTLVVIAAFVDVGFIAALVKRDRHGIAIWCGGLVLVILAATWVVFDRLRVTWRDRA